MRESFRAWVLFVFVFAVGSFVAVSEANAGPGLFDAVSGLVGQTPKIDSQQAIANVRGRPVRASEIGHYAQSVGTSTVHVFGNSASGGLAEATYQEQVGQVIRVSNYHASQPVCLTVVARATSSTTCHSACGAAAMTCNAGGGVTTDGTRLTSSMPPFGITITGLDCLCAESSAADTTITATRIARAPNL